MKLRPEYKTVTSSLLSRSPLPFLDVCLNELLREEQRIRTKAHLEQQHITTHPVAYSTKGNTQSLQVSQSFPTPQTQDMSKVQCYSCKKYGHLATQCNQKFCNYCKKKGHIIIECRRRHQARTPNAYTAKMDFSTADATSTSVPSQPSLSSTALTPELVQQMIVNAFSTLGITGKSKTPSSIWYLDSEASNHLTHSSAQLSSLTKYTGNTHVQTANGGHLPTTAIGDISSILPLKNVYHYPNLISNLISLRQLVENDYKVSFSSSGCVVQDQMSGREIARGPKRGRLFSLILSTPIRNISAYDFCFSAQNNFQLWHTRLGHPNFKTMSHMVNSGL